MTPRPENTAHPVAPPPESVPGLQRRWALFFGYLLVFPLLLQLLFGAASFSFVHWIDWGASLLFRGALGALAFMCMPRKNTPAAFFLMAAVSLTAGVFNLLDIYLLVNFGVLFDFETWRLMSNAPLHEVSGFFRLFLFRSETPAILLVYPLAGVLIFLVKKRRGIYVSLLILTAALLLFFALRSEKRRKFTPGSPGSRMTGFVEGWRKAKIRRGIASANLDLKVENSDRKALYLLVIGESHSRRRSSLYGFPRNTTPNLKKLFERGGLFRFDDAVSPHVMTHLALPRLLSLEDSRSGSTFRELPNVPDLFRAGGFKVWYLYNQMPDSEEQLPFLAIAGRADCFLSLSRRGPRYDMVMAEALEEILKDPAPKKFLILHLRGSHWEYRKTFPPAFRFFTGAGKDPRRGGIINDYDNSLRYLDHVLSRLIRIVEGEKCNAFLLYLPDHGEALYEEEDFVGHTDLFPTAASCELPMFLWISDTFGDEAVRSRLRGSVTRPFFSEDLPHLLMELGKLRTPLFRAERSLINDAYKAAPRRVSTRRIDYETMKNKSRPTPAR